MNQFDKNRTAKFGRNIVTEISGPPAEVIPNSLVGRDGNGPLTFDRNSQNLWHNAKYPSM